MKLPTLYKNSKRGATQQWTIEVENNTYRTIAGQVGGKLTVTEWTTCQGLNIGKSNATTANEQALKDAQSNWQYKIDRANYATSIEGIADVKFKEPMLAKNYKDRKDNIDFSKGVYGQSKLNGCLQYNTKLQLEDGRILDIGYIVENNILGKVKSHNINTGKVEYQQIVDHMKIPKSTVYNDCRDDWYEIITEDNKTLTVTGNHRIWINNLNCWRRVCDLDGTEDLLITV